jgi:putative nucleotidyltransferase with HDIG domain
MVTEDKGDYSDRDPDPYAGRWIATLNDRVVGQGGSPKQALLAAQATRFKEKPTITYVPTSKPFEFNELFERVRSALPASLKVYLVGGAVRDLLLSRQIHDLDFALAGDVLRLSRRLADQLGGAYFPLDEERDTARIVLMAEDGSRQILDMAAIRGQDIEADLKARDFTINAMAIALDDPQALLDPCGGAADLHARLLRACSATSLRDDPLRILRGIRQAAAFNLHIVPETRRSMKAAASLLPHVSAERVRDELFHILETSKPAVSIRALEILGVLPHVLPELPALKGVDQSPPHITDVWDHTLDVLKNLELLLSVLAIQPDSDKSANWTMGLVSMRLGRFRSQLSQHIHESVLNQDRSPLSLLLLAALYHDVAKPATQRLEADGRIRFLKHDQLGAQIASQRGRDLRLSNPEIERLRLIVQHHMRPLLLAYSGQSPSRRAISRFFRDTSAAGVDICLLSLADALATYGPSIPQDLWANHVEVVRTLLEAWWENPQESVEPAPLLNGHDLINEFDLKPGPEIGKLIEIVREAQAAGEVNDLASARALINEYLSPGDR